MASGDIKQFGMWKCISSNAVSYKTYRNFHDNNTTYLDLQRYLNKFTGVDWFVEVSENVLFKNDGNDADRYQEFEQ